MLGNGSVRSGSRTRHAAVTGRLVISGMLSGLLAVMCGGVPHAAAEPPIVAFDRFVHDSNPVCRSRSAADCVTRAWGFADADGNGGLSLEELEGLRADLEVWAIWRQAELAAHERSGIAFGLWLIDSLGLDYLHAAYDADHDGLISRSELLADVHLDERPIGTVLLDPGAVDHAAIARRLGLPPYVLERLPFPPPD
jgi:EF hand